MNIERVSNNHLYLSQPYLILRILKVVNLNPYENSRENTKATTPTTKPLLIKDTNRELYELY